MGLEAWLGRHASFIRLAFKKGGNGEYMGGTKQLAISCDSHRRIHSAKPLNRSVYPAADAGESGARLSEIFSSEMMTDAQ